MLNKQKLHKFLFPTEHADLIDARKLIQLSSDEIKARDATIRTIHKRIEYLEEKPAASLADLMRANLGIETLDMVNVQHEGKEAGLPMHFLLAADPAKRATFISQLSQIYQTEVWHEMTRYHLNYQGNYSFRVAATDMEIFAGRMSANGIALLRNDVKKGHDEYMEGSKPKGDYTENDDERFETTEGVPIKNSDNNQ